MAPVWAASVAPVCLRTLAYAAGGGFVQAPSRRTILLVICGRLRRVYAAGHRLDPVKFRIGSEVSGDVC